MPLKKIKNIKNFNSLCVLDLQLLLNNMSSTFKENYPCIRIRVKGVVNIATKDNEAKLRSSKAADIN